MPALNEQQRDVISARGLNDIIRGCRVLVTGASGFIGSHLVEALVELGADVYALSRSMEKQGVSINVHAHSVDLQELTAVRRHIKEIRPEVVYHLAGLVNARQDLGLVLPTLQNNLVGSVNLFLVLAEAPCHRVVVVGSSEEPGAGHLGNAANSPYAAAKEAETSYARMFYRVFSLPVVVTRPFMSYGPRQPIEKLVPYVITSLLNGVAPQLGSGRRVCDLIYVQDLVMGLLLSGFCPNHIAETLDLGTGIGVTIHDAATLISNLIAGPVKPSFGAIPDRLHESPQVAKVEETFRFLGYRPIWSLEDGLRATIAWYRQNPWFYQET